MSTEKTTKTKTEKATRSPRRKIVGQDTAPPEPRKRSPDLYDYLVDRMGGEDAAMHKFLQEQLRERVRAGATFQDLFDFAARERADDVLVGMRVRDVVDVTTNGRRSGTRRRSGRRTSLQTTRRRILGALEDGPHATAELADRLGEDVGRVRRQLRRLQQEDAVVPQGSRRPRTYTLPADAS